LLLTGPGKAPGIACSIGVRKPPVNNPRGVVPATYAGGHGIASDAHSPAERALTGATPAANCVLAAYKASGIRSGPRRLPDAAGETYFAARLITIWHARI